MEIILVIDDDADLRGLLARTLASEGYLVHEAENGRAGCELAEELQPDVVLVDLWMPVQEGLQTIRRIHAMLPKAKIITMSGRPMLGGISLFRIARREGANAAVAKPFSPYEMVKLVDDLIAGAPNAATNGSMA
ncbi:MAG TPA: response regulator [Chthoniobacteraceae bacterium]|jgi:CheY-like chemotaxis protein